MATYLFKINIQMKIYNLPVEIIGEIVYHLDENSTFNLIITCKKLADIVAYYWMGKIEDDIFDIVNDVLNIKLHIVKNDELLKKDVYDNITRIIHYIIDFDDQTQDFYHLIDMNLLHMSNKMFRGVSSKYINSYKLVYFQLIYNQIYKRKFMLNILSVITYA